MLIHRLTVLPMEEHDWEQIQLEPFVHQVGGHSSMLCLDEETVCKPLIAREMDFYKSLPPAMKGFTPQYKGIVEVNIKTSEDGYVTLSATPNTVNRRCSKKPNCQSRIRIRQTGSIEIEGDVNSVFEEHESHDRRGSGLNPWVLKCHREHLTKLLRDSSSTRPIPQKFILLENLTWRFRHPCILDLKMGTRQYADDATPAKMQSKKAKVASTTSGKLGIRICGMQVYQVENDRYNCWNKYYGRSLDSNGFKEALCRFLHNGDQIRIDIIPRMLAKLQELKIILEQLNTFRFYTSSLLIIYDGEQLELCEPNAPLPQRVRHSVSGEIHVKSDLTMPVWKTERSRSLEMEPRMYGGVDVRMIDFAHSTHKGFQEDPRIYSGPDTGFIFGIENLMQLLRSIGKEYG